jgi:hypothetical protein
MAGQRNTFENTVAAFAPRQNVIFSIDPGSGAVHCLAFYEYKVKVRTHQILPTGKDEILENLPGFTTIGLPSPSSFSKNELDEMEMFEFLAA